jgi:hypothetical protein
MHQLRAQIDESDNFEVSQKKSYKVPVCFRSCTDGSRKCTLFV